MDRKILKFDLLYEMEKDGSIIRKFNYGEKIK